MRVLVIEDNKRLRDSLRRVLEGEGYVVDTSADGVDGEELATIGGYDLILLDIMLPEKDGLAVCSSLRQKHINGPILMLTARDALDDRVKGLDSGADDYLIKPFEVDELLARARALMRRNSSDRSSVLRVADLSVDPATREVRRADTLIEMTSKEYALLELFMRHPGHILTRDQVSASLWSYDHVVVSNAIDVYIRRLRRKIDDPFEVKLFETIRGAGYRLKDPTKQ